MLGGSICGAPARCADADRSLAPYPQLTPDQLREDLQYLRDEWAPLDQSFSEAQRKQFNTTIEDTLARADTLSTEDFALDVMRAAAIPRNGHTTAMVGRLLHDLPVRTWWFADGLYIISVHPQFVDLLGAQITRFGSLASSEALRRVSPFISGNDQRVLYLSAVYLSSPAVLRRIGVAPGLTDIPITLQLPTGTERTVLLSPTTEPDPGNRHEPFDSGYSVLIPDDADLPGRWVHILDNIASRPLTYGAPVDVSCTWLGDGGKVLYIRSNSVLSLDKTPLGMKLGSVLRNFVVEQEPRSVVFDLRLNNGGDFFSTILFSQALPRLLGPNGRIFVLVGRCTFSAALVTAAMLKGASPKQVTFIGEAMGDNGHFWAETGTRTLPNSRIPMQYSTRFEDYETGCFDLEKCYWASVAFGPRNISLQPDIKVHASFADYAAGRDPVLQTSLSLAR